MVKQSGLGRALVELEYEGFDDLVQSELRAGKAPADLMGELREGLEIVGERFHTGEYFIGELLIGSKMMKSAMDILLPHLSSESEVESEGTIVLGAIMGDAHDFGKMIVRTLLIASGFKVHDLGVDVSPEQFVDEAVRVNADVIGISALLSATQQNIKAVVKELEKRGLRKQFKVIVGGSAVTQRAIEAYGVDAAVNDASEGVEIIKGWIKESSPCR